MSLSILMVGSEALPFSKTGGLADVLGALPIALGKLGHRVTLVTPRYRGAKAQGTATTILVPGIGGVVSETRVIEQPLAENVKAVLVDRPELYDRDSIYGSGGDYPDSPRRFGFLCKAALEYALRAEQPFDVLHGHDWQAGLAAVYLRTRYATEPKLRGMASVFTIHNLAYQGIFPVDWLAPLELSLEMMSIDALEFWGQMSFLKGGIVFSDRITTVSPTYAEEIQTEEYGAGFEGILAARSKDLRGILNGIDTDRWDPRRDPYLPEPYDETSTEKKESAARALVELLGPSMSFDRLARPLVGIVSRLVDQKGFDLIAELASALPDFGSFAVLGSGDAAHEKMWRDLAAAYPDRFAVKIGFDESLAHLIEGAADMFLMPSRFEPCGLNQMYSMRYGTVPVVRATGGLDDTVTDYNEATGAGTGFKFTDYSAAALLEAMERARTVFANPTLWKTLQVTGMRQDFSWDRSAREYVKLYESALAGPRAYIGALGRARASGPDVTSRPGPDLTVGDTMASEKIQIFTDGNFDQTVVKSDKPVLVDFWAEWCGPCRRLAPTVDALATDYDGKVTVGKLNVDENPNTAGRFSIRGIPTILIFKGGEIVESIVGLAEKDHLKQLIDKHV